MHPVTDAPKRNRTGDRMTRFVFTLNNWTQPEYDWLTTSFLENTKWLVIGKEVGENGTPHLQGAVVLAKQTSFSTIKTWSGLCRAHLEKMHGRPADSLKYCSKQDSRPFVHGTLPTPGKRNDLTEIVLRIQEGESLKQLAQDEEGGVAIVKFSKGLTILRSLRARIRDPAFPPKVIWIFGQTGHSKTRCAFEFGCKFYGGTDEVWISSGGLRWFDGYDGQKVAILDDLRSKQVPQFAFLLRLLDRYPMSVEFKGGFVNWAPELIFITSAYDPEECFATRNTHRPEDIRQLTRRLVKVCNFASAMDTEEKMGVVFNSWRELLGMPACSEEGEAMSID